MKKYLFFVIGSFLFCSVQANVNRRVMVSGSTDFLNGLSCTRGASSGQEWVVNCTYNGFTETFKGIAFCAGSSGVYNYGVVADPQPVSSYNRFCFCRMYWPALSSWYRIDDPVQGESPVFSTTASCLNGGCRWNCEQDFIEGGFERYFKNSEYISY